MGRALLSHTLFSSEVVISPVIQLVGSRMEKVFQDITGNGGTDQGTMFITFGNCAVAKKGSDSQKNLT